MTRQPLITQQAGQTFMSMSTKKKITNRFDTRTKEDMKLN